MLLREHLVGRKAEEAQLYGLAQSVKAQNGS